MAITVNDCRLTEIAKFGHKWKSANEIAVFFLFLPFFLASEVYKQGKNPEFHFVISPLCS